MLFKPSDLPLPGRVRCEAQPSGSGPMYATPLGGNVGDFGHRRPFPLGGARQGELRPVSNDHGRFTEPGCQAPVFIAALNPSGPPLSIRAGWHS